MLPLSPAASLASANNMLSISRSIVLRTKSTVAANNTAAAAKATTFPSKVQVQVQQQVQVPQNANMNANVNMNVNLNNMNNNPINGHSHNYTTSTKGNSKRSNVSVNNYNSCGCSCIIDSTSSSASAVSTSNPNFNFNLTTIRLFTSSSPSSASIMKRDKYGRLMQRRIVVRSNNQRNTTRSDKSKKKNGNKSSKDAQSSFWPKLPKIITPTNVLPQPIQPISAAKGNSAAASASSSSSGLKPSSNAPTCIITESAVVPSSSTSTSTSASTTSATANTGTGSGTSTSAILSSLSSSSSSSSSNAPISSIVSSNSQSSSSSTATSTTTGALAAAAASSKSNHHNHNSHKTRKKFLEWLKQNAGTIVLNIGSIATLTGFSRTDMLELRMLSMVGSSSTIIYFLSRTKDLVYGPIIWSSIFLFTNSYMAYGILEERKGKTRQFTIEEEDLYEEHFLPYGVTPRMYEKLLSICTKVSLKRGEVLIEKGQKFDAVYLVTSGSTSGMTHLHRRVTAASSSKGNREKLSGGDAGAWIGELAFLELLGEESSSSTSSSMSTTSTVSVDTNSKKHNNDNKGVSIPAGGGGVGGATPARMAQNQLTKMSTKLNNSDVGNGSTNTKSSSTRSQSHNHDNDAVDEGVVKTLATAAVNSTGINTFLMNNNNGNDTPQNTNNNNEDKAKKRKTINKALLTYLANQDSTLIKWDFEELAELLSTSTELRLAVTRAMTAAVVNKVVNLYVSKQEGHHMVGNGSDSHANEDEEVEAHDDEPDVSMWKQWMVSASSKTADKIQKEEEEQEKKMKNVPGAHRRSSLRPGAVRLNVVKENRK